jgi:hypothetical protein
MVNCHVVSCGEGIAYSASALLLCTFEVTEYVPVGCGVRLLYAEYRLSAFENIDIV